MNYVHEDDQQYFADYGDGDIVVQANYPLGPPTLVSRVKDWFEGFRPPESTGKRRKKRLRDKKNQVTQLIQSGTVVNNSRGCVNPPQRLDVVRRQDHAR